MTLRASLSSWIAESDAQSYVDLFPGSLIERSLETFQQRFAEYYISLVSELFDLMREAPTGDDSGSTWASLGNALADVANRDRQDLATNAGVSLNEARLFGATAFYCGGFPASAYIVANTIDRPMVRDDITRACVEIMLRPAVLEAATTQALVGFIRSGDTAGIEALARAARDGADTALDIGPSEWVPATLLFRLLEQLQARNVRAVLPDGESDFWNPLVASFLARRPPVWEFFPSQILAIDSGLLSRPETFSLQMPTGSGKTALTETVLYQHAIANQGSPAVLIVPYRSLASELRRTLVRRLNALGVQARSSYGGSVPNPVETRDLDSLSVLVATPETLSGTLGANETFYRRVGLVVCDEGHLLDSDSRGVALELLLARLRARESGPPRFIFISAIVPNVEEINSWLGGANDTVVLSDYRPALAEFALLRNVSTPQRAVDLVMHPEAHEPTKFTLQSFLDADDFKFINRVTGRPNTYAWASIRARAVAAARKALTLGPVAVFSATKGGGQGAIGLADELVTQMERDLPLPNPIDVARRDVVAQGSRLHGTGIRKRLGRDPSS